LKNIAIFASGTGTNAQKIIDYFQGHPNIHVDCIVSNKRKAGVIQIARNEGIPYILITKESFKESEQLVGQLNNRNIDLIVLAGFLWLIPEYLVKAFPNRIVNIHPALLPKFGGKGMYGMHVHEAVQAAGETESGITIHYVNEHYDEGQIIFQARCPVESTDSPEVISQKVRQLEHEHFAQVIESVLTS